MNTYITKYPQLHLFLVQDILYCSDFAAINNWHATKSTFSHDTVLKNPDDGAIKIWIKSWVLRHQSMSCVKLLWGLHESQTEGASLFFWSAGTRNWFNNYNHHQLPTLVMFSQYFLFKLQSNGTWLYNATFAE